MKFLFLAFILILCAVTPARAVDVYGCIVNETPDSMNGFISSDSGKLNFTVQGDYIWCCKLPEGNYSVFSDDSKFKKNFSASWQRSLGMAGDEILHWVVKIKEQDLE
ncbi:hypothetical protein [Maridesulfovibrio zosterae]|uniref:hypothetical protein n=1 Tax=Maridesulfovibrio zosterae TaxID=82171 RepID=UPI0003F84770|nr:hypothetical protein [Maridesulfovibrio zosterae]